MQHFGKEAQVKPSLPHLRKRLRLNSKVKPSLPSGETVIATLEEEAQVKL